MSAQRRRADDTTEEWRFAGDDEPFIVPETWTTHGRKESAESDERRFYAVEATIGPELLWTVSDVSGDAVAGPHRERTVVQVCYVSRDGRTAFERSWDASKQSDGWVPSSDFASVLARDPDAGSPVRRDQRAASWREFIEDRYDVVPIVTDGGEDLVEACPECDSTSIHALVRDTSDWDYYCGDCGERFDEPEVRTRHNSPTNRVGLAGVLSDADPDDVSADPEPDDQLVTDGGQDVDEDDQDDSSNGRSCRECGYQPDQESGRFKSGGGWNVSLDTVNDGRALVQYERWTCPVCGTGIRETELSRSRFDDREPVPDGGTLLEDVDEDDQDEDVFDECECGGVFILDQSTLLDDVVRFRCSEPYCDRGNVVSREKARQMLGESLEALR